MSSSEKHVFLLIFYPHCYFYSVPYFLYLLISALLDFSGYLPLSRGASAILGIFSHVMMGHLLSMLQISFNDYANISDDAKASLKTMFKITSLMFSRFCRLLSDIASCWLKSVISHYQQCQHCQHRQNCHHSQHGITSDLKEFQGISRVLKEFWIYHPNVNCQNCENLQKCQEWKCIASIGTNFCACYVYISLHYGSKRC